MMIKSDRLAEIRWSVCISKSKGSLCVSFSRTDSGLCIHHFFVWSNCNFLHSFQLITLPTESCLLLYSFLSMFAAFAYCVIDRFVSITTLPTSAVLLRLIYFLFWYCWSLWRCFCAAIRRFNFSLKISYYFHYYSSISFKFKLVIFHRSLRDSKSSQDSRTTSQYSNWFYLGCDLNGHSYHSFLSKEKKYWKRFWDIWINLDKWSRSIR